MLHLPQFDTWQHKNTYETLLNTLQNSLQLLQAECNRLDSLTVDLSGRIEVLEKENILLKEQQTPASLNPRRIKIRFGDPDDA